MTKTNDVNLLDNFNCQTIDWFVFNLSLGRLRQESKGEALSDALSEALIAVDGRAVLLHPGVEFQLKLRKMQLEIHKATSIDEWLLAFDFWLDALQCRISTKSFLFTSTNWIVPNKRLANRKNLLCLICIHPQPQLTN